MHLQGGKMTDLSVLLPMAGGCSGSPMQEELLRNKAGVVVW